MGTQSKQGGHTAGPWKVDIAPDASGHYTIRRDDGTPYGDTESQPIATVYTKEDAVAVAAAPDLLAACEAALECVEAITRGDHFDGAQMAGDLQDAIAKARPGAGK